LIEGNLDAFLGVRFLASEYSTGKKYGADVRHRIAPMNRLRTRIPVRMTVEQTIVERRNLCGHG
jgi:hypothetical protein